ncbi:MAG: hypothetical protein WBX38_21685 [Candidatus Sulfotelmatobacter sp.]
MKPSFTMRVVAVLTVFVASNSIALAQGLKPISSPSSNGGTSSAAFESQMLSYGGLQHVASALGKTVCASDGVDFDNSIVVIYDQTAFASLQAYEAFVTNIQVVSSGYRTLIPKADLQSSLSSIFNERSTDFGALAKSEQNPEKKRLYEYKSKRYSMSLAPIDPFSDAAALITALAVASNSETPGQVAIPDSAMAIALTREIRANCKNGVTVIYPPLFGKASSTDVSAANIQMAIQTLNDLRTIALGNVSRGNQAFLSNLPQQTSVSKAITKGKSATDQTVDTTTNQTAFAQISADPVLSAALTDINGLYDSFINSLLQINSTTGLAGSATVIQGYRLASLLTGVQCAESQKDSNGQCPTDTLPYSKWQQRPGFVVLASVANAGGTQHDHKTLWTALSTGDKITYSGGVMVNAVLWSAGSSAPRYLDVLRYRAPFSELKSPRDVRGLDTGDNLP